VSLNEVNSNFTPWFIHFGPNVRLRRSQHETFARPPIAKKVPADNENLIRELRRVGVSLAFPAHAEQIHSAYIKSLTLFDEGASVSRRRRRDCRESHFIPNAAAASCALITALISP
jgi:hypothetical protein